MKMTRRKRNNEDVVSHLEICDEAIVEDEAVDLLTNDVCHSISKAFSKDCFQMSTCNF